MSENKSKWRQELKELIESAAEEPTNVASAVNVGGRNRRTSTSTRQRVVQRDGTTTKVTETREERRADD